MEAWSTVAGPCNSLIGIQKISIGYGTHHLDDGKGYNMCSPSWVSSFEYPTYTGLQAWIWIWTVGSLWLNNANIAAIALDQ